MLFMGMNGSGFFLIVMILFFVMFGFYNYVMDCLYCVCGMEGWVEVDFNFDIIGQGSYVMINVSNFDDVVVVVVNGYIVFVGYLNVGLVYSGNYFGQNMVVFQFGYFWSEVMGLICMVWDWDGNCIVSMFFYIMFYVNIKLFDYCLLGYLLMFQI